MHGDARVLSQEVGPVMPGQGPEEGDRLEFRVAAGLGFRVKGLGFRVDLELRRGFGIFGVQGLGVENVEEGLEFLGFRVQGNLEEGLEFLGFRVQGNLEEGLEILGFRVWGFRA